MHSLSLVLVCGSQHQHSSCWYRLAVAVYKHKIGRLLSHLCNSRTIRSILCSQWSPLLCVYAVVYITLIVLIVCITCSSTNSALVPACCMCLVLVLDGVMCRSIPSGRMFMPLLRRVWKFSHLSLGRKRWNPRYYGMRVLLPCLFTFHTLDE